MKLKFTALILVTLCFTSCLDIIETFNINEDGSGVYEQQMDFSRAMQGMMAMMSEKGQEKRKGKEMEKKDSTFSYKSIVDTSTHLTAAEKAVFGKAYAKMHMDEEKGEILINIFYPFANAKEFETIQQVLAKDNNSGNFFEALMKATSGDKYNKNAMQNPATGEGDKQGLEMMKEMMKVNLKTIIHLPRPAKSSKGNFILSADKKELSFDKTIDISKKMAATDFDFSIDY
jgi:hypothetical protein